MLRSLRRREYRLYFLGQLFSLSGTWMQSVAQAWLVYRLTQSSFMLGLVAFCALIPVLLFGLMGGWLADHLPRRRLFLGAQLVAMAQALLLAALTFADLIQVWHIVLLAFTLGMVHAVEMPARHAMMAGLVPREELHNAIALNTGLFNLARFAGPALAGVLIAQVGEAWVFTINGVSFLATIAALLLMGAETGNGTGGAKRGGIAAGLRYTWRQPAMRDAILLVSAVSLFASPFNVLMPVFTHEVLAAGPEKLGFLLGAIGCGALLAALRLARRSAGPGIQRWSAVAALVAALALVLFSQLRHFALAVPVLVIAGFAVTTVIASTNTYLQLAAPDELRGRVMSLFATLFIGVAPLGNLLAGSLAEWLGVQTAMLCLGLGCLLAAGVYGWRERFVSAARAG